MTQRMRSPMAVLAALAAVAAVAMPAAATPPRPSPAPITTPVTRPMRPVAARPAASPATRAIVKFRSTVSATGSADVRARLRLARERRLPLTGAEVVRVAPGADLDAVVERLRGDPRVVYAEPDQRVWATTTNDARFAQLWGLNNTGQRVDGVVGTADVDVDAPQAWAATTGDDATVVAVVDTGVDWRHTDLAANIWVNPDEVPGDRVDNDGNGYVDDVRGWDFVHDDASVFDPGDGDEHGTHVAGTIAAVKDNALGVAGVAPSVTVMPLKFLGPDGSGFTSDAIRAIAYAKAMGVRVVNASWGSYQYSRALRDAVAGSGLAVVAAAGNEGLDADRYPSYPAALDLPNVLSVAAVNSRGGLARFSNRGAASVDVAAPGVDVLSTVPRARRATSALLVTGRVFKAVHLGFGLEDVAGRRARRDLLAQSLAFLRRPPGARILLVDDDQSDIGFPNAGGAYTRALADAGYRRVTVRSVRTDASGPTAAQMRGRTVIWQTGDAFGWNARTLTRTDRRHLETFLSGGGRLILAGPDAIYANETSRFVTGYLHARWLGEVPARQVEARGGWGTRFHGRAYRLTGAESGDRVSSPYRDAVAPRDSRARATLLMPEEATYASAYASYDGTSMAAPHAAGVAALVASARPDLGPTELVDVVASTAQPLRSLDGRTRTSGLVNAAAALQP